MKSAYFNTYALKALNKIGDILLPGSDEFPSFSSYGCIEHIDGVLDYAMKDDVKSLNLVLSLLHFMPHLLLVGLIRKMSHAHQSNGAAGDLLRQLNMGLRGIVFSLYYSDKAGENYTGSHPASMIGFDLRKAMN
jgi:hypothetical protein